VTARVSEVEKREKEKFLFNSYYYIHFSFGKLVLYTNISFNMLWLKNLKIPPLRSEPRKPSNRNF